MPFVGSVQAKLVVKKQRRGLIYFTEIDLQRGKVISDSLVITMDMEGVDF